MDKGTNEIHVFHEDLLKNDKDYFKSHPATEEYIRNIPDQEDGELVLYSYLYSVLFNTFKEMQTYLIENKQNAEIDTAEDKNSIDLHKHISQIKKLHVFDERLLDHLELSLILWLYENENDIELRNLRQTLDEKILPKSDASINKSKTPTLDKATAGHLAYFITKEGISTRQAILLSEEITGVSFSVINKILPDITESYQGGYLEKFYPITIYSKSLLLIHLLKRAKAIEQMAESYNNDTINKTRRNKFFETYQAYIHFTKTSANELMRKIPEEDISHISELILSNPPKKLPVTFKSIEINENDNNRTIIIKAGSIAGAFIQRLSQPDTPAKDLYLPEN